MARSVFFLVLFNDTIKAKTCSAMMEFASTALPLGLWVNAPFFFSLSHIVHTLIVGNRWGCIVHWCTNPMATRFLNHLFVVIGKSSPLSFSLCVNVANRFLEN